MAPKDGAVGAFQGIIFTNDLRYSGVMLVISAGETPLYLWLS